MPPDVATYALNREPTVPRKLDQVKFQVARWTPEDGVTVVKRFPAAPGEIIGEVSSVAVPIADERRQEAGEQEDRLQQPPARPRRDGGRPADPAARAGHRRPALGPGARRWSSAATARSSSATRRTTSTTRSARTWPTTLPASSRRPKKTRRRSKKGGGGSEAAQ